MVVANCWAQESSALAVRCSSASMKRAISRKCAAIVYGDIRRLLLPDHNSGDSVRQGIDLLIDSRTIRGGDVGTWVLLRQVLQPFTGLEVAGTRRAPSAVLFCGPAILSTV